MSAYPDHPIGTVMRDFATGQVWRMTESGWVDDTPIMTPSLLWLRQAANNALKKEQERLSNLYPLANLFHVHSAENIQSWRKISMENSGGSRDDTRMYECPVKPVTRESDDFFGERDSWRTTEQAIEAWNTRE